MVISFKNTKENKVYRNFVDNPLDRKALRAFCAVYPSAIADEAVKLHKRLIYYPTAADYNKVYGGTLNGIETMQGRKDNKPFVLKARITQGYRIFFHHLIGDSDFLLTRNWCGDFCAIEKIHIIEANKHNYNL